MAEIPTPDRRQGIMKITITILTLLLVSLEAGAGNFDPAWGRDGMVVTSVAPAAEAGRQVLEKGGNAFDAAVAMSFAASVAHPFSSGLGGGMFAVTFESESGAMRSLDARETAPASASAEFYENNPALGSTDRTGHRTGRAGCHGGHLASHGGVVGGRSVGGISGNTKNPDRRGQGTAAGLDYQATRAGGHPEGRPGKGRKSPGAGTHCSKDRGGNRRRGDTARPGSLPAHLA